MFNLFTVLSLPFFLSPGEEEKVLPREGEQDSVFLSEQVNKKQVSNNNQLYTFNTTFVIKDESEKKKFRRSIISKGGGQPLKKKILRLPNLFG